MATRRTGERTPNFAPTPTPRPEKFLRKKSPPVIIPAPQEPYTPARPLFTRGKCAARPAPAQPGFALLDARIIAVLDPLLPTTAERITAAVFPDLTPEQSRKGKVWPYRQGIFCSSVWLVWWRLRRLYRQGLLHRSQPYRTEQFWLRRADEATPRLP